MRADRGKILDKRPACLISMNYMCVTYNNNNDYIDILLMGIAIYTPWIHVHIHKKCYIIFMRVRGVIKANEVENALQGTFMRHL